jgi:adenine specific DNA methylase Mod
VPYRLIHCDGELSAGNPDAGNLLVQGDNLEALKALLPYYAGKVKCIYIDPPYNTGNEAWIYNDNVNSPEIRKWLGEVVGNEAADLSRHDKWLCMMRPRLRLLSEFLTKDGIILVSIGDDELHNLIYLMHEIFGEAKSQAIFVWKSRAKPSNTGDAKLKPQNDAEYIVCFSNSQKASYFLQNSGKDRSYPHADEDGNYRLQTILKSNRGESKRETMQFSINRYTPPPTKRWQAGEDTIIDLFERNRISFQTGEPMLKYYEHEEADEYAPFYCFIEKEVSGTAEGGKELLNRMIGNTHGFDTVKPIGLLNYLISRTTTKNDIVLDSFAGSGTTAHSVLAVNEIDNQSRKFILIEMDRNIAETVTQARLRAAVSGYKYETKKNSVKVDGLSGGFRYCTLGQPLFNEFGDIDPGVTFPDLASHIFFSETGAPIPHKAKGDSSFIGTYMEKAVFLLFSAAEQGIAREAAGNVLTPDLLAQLPPVPEGFTGQRVVYGEGCTVTSDRLKVEGVTFKQIPYQIEAN